MGPSRFRQVVVLLLALWAGLVSAASAEPRIALVVGNSSYVSVTSLENPKNDARLIADTLGKLGFKVTLLIDAGLSDFRQAIASFGRDLRAAGPEATGLFYYAGHGLQSFQTNYLLPVDAQLTDAADISLVGIEADAVLRQMSSARNRTNIVILDACRNNPFQSIPAFDEPGLAEMKAPTGTFLAYATAPNMVALDGEGGNSPFTAALTALMPTPGLPIEQMFKKVRVAVLAATSGLQTPWDASSLTNDFYFAAGTPQTAEDKLWESVKASRDPVQIMLFLQAYPDGTHFEDARRLLAEVMEFDLAGKPGDGKPQPTPEPTPEPVAPDAGEQADFDAAQADGSVASWEDFLDQHPKSVFREIAEAELAAARKKAGRDTEVNPPGQGGDGSAPLTLDIFFDRPLAEGGSNVAGRSMSEIITGSPLFPPVEGLPEEVWKGKHCSDCHHWTKDALCAQGKFYVNNSIDDGLGAIHPLGGQFRKVLKAWAAQGCR